MVAKIASFFLLSSLLLVQLSAAPSVQRLQCGTADAKSCKQQFAELFQKGFQEAVIDFAEISCDFVEIAINDALAQFPDDAAKENLTDFKSKVIGLRQRLMEADHDNDKILAVIKDMSILGEVHSLSNLIKDSEKLDKNMKDSLAKFGDDVVVLWRHLYIGLRPNDLQEYPQYDAFNKEMEAVPGEKNDLIKSLKFGRALREVLEFFGLQNLYFFGC